nr:MAG TPA_asm: hypothetical protein [Caudoviricetes sp.]
MAYRSYGSGPPKRPASPPIKETCKGAVKRRSLWLR